MISLKIQGATRVSNNLRSLVAKNAQIIDLVIGDYTKELRKRIKGRRAPPKPPQSTYVRTGRMQNSFRAVKIRPGSWAIANSTDYWQWVTFEGRQVHFHAANGWWTIQQIEREGRKELTLALVKEVQDYVS